MIGWQTRAAALAAALTEGGAVTDPRWDSALRTTPRHVLVPSFHEQRRDLSGWETVSEQTDPDRWADAVYADRTLVTELRSTPAVFDGYPVPVSSSTLPSLMARMLHALDVRDGDTVVEIGTGTGYNAALLCARIGDRRVHSVDVEPELVDLARRRLATIGHHPRLDCVDAGDWQPPPFDRLIATCGAHTIAPGWLSAARRDAVMVVPLTGPLADGGLVRLTADGDGNASGRFATFYAGFMPQRRPRSTTPPATRPPPPIPTRADSTGEQAGGVRASVVDPALLAASEPLAMLTQLRLPPLGPRTTGTTGEGLPVTTLVADDGSWVRAEHRDDGARVHSGGPVDLWNTVETTHDWWTARGRPGWDRLGLTATQHTQTIWLDDPGHPIHIRPATTTNREPADPHGSS